MGFDVLVLHDYLTQRGGAERVALTLAVGIADGKLTTCVYSAEDTFSEFAALEVTELAPGLPRRAKLARATTAPVAAASFSRHSAEADVVVCSSSGWSHWTSTPSPTVVYCHTPPRWFWAGDDYVAGMPTAMRSTASRLLSAGRAADRRRALARTTYVANSTTVRDRIRAAYGIDAEVVHPPVALDPTGPVEPVPGVEPGFVLTVSRARGYKNLAVAEEAFRGGALGQLVVVGDRHRAGRGAGAVVPVGRVSDAQLRWLYREARGVLGLSREDFGLTPVEGHLFGTPTVALRAGGYLDTCEEGVNGVFAESLDIAEVRRAVRSLDRAVLRPDVVAASAARFSPEAFIATMTGIAERVAARSPS